MPKSKRDDSNKPKISFCLFSTKQAAKAKNNINKQSIKTSLTLSTLKLK